jgi:1,4-dihydroxy-2-naphthoate octaprenyltransferase
MKKLNLKVLAVLISLFVFFSVGVIFVSLYIHPLWSLLILALTLYILYTDVSDFLDNQARKERIAEKKRKLS